MPATAATRSEENSTDWFAYLATQISTSRAVNSSFLQNMMNATYGEPTSENAVGGATYVMFGYGSSITFTPRRSGRVLLVMGGITYVSQAGDAGSYQGTYGTGTAPTNGAALTGTISFPIWSMNSSFGLNQIVFVMLSGLTVGTPYWFDIAGYNSTSAARTTAFDNPQYFIMEI